MIAFPSEPVTMLPTVFPWTKYSTVTPASAWLVTALRVVIVMVCS